MVQGETHWVRGWMSQQAARQAWLVSKDSRNAGRHAGRHARAFCSKPLWLKTHSYKTLRASIHRLAV